MGIGLRGLVRLALRRRAAVDLAGGALPSTARGESAAVGRFTGTSLGRRVPSESPPSALLAPR